MTESEPKTKFMGPLPQEIIKVRQSDRTPDNLIDGGYSYWYDVLECTVKPENGILTYDIRGPVPPVNMTNMPLLESMGKALAEVHKAVGGSSFQQNVTEMREVDDEILDELRGRGVEIIYELPDEAPYTPSPLDEWA